MSNLVVALLFVVILVRTSHLLFGVNLKEQIQNGNKAVAIFTLGLMVMVGIVIGLFKV